MQSYVELAGLSVDSFKEGQKNHYTITWPWQEQQLIKTKLFAVDNYVMYDVKPISAK
jgi:hypothetical protein